MLTDTAAEFWKIVDGIYGTFLDARDGFNRVYQRMNEIEADAATRLENEKEQRPELAHLELGDAEFSYGRFIPAGSPERRRHLHQVPMETIRKRNAKGGDNFHFIGNMCLVTLYQYWEDHYRTAFANDLGVGRNELKVPVFGDIRRYRRAILHNRGVATSDIEKCEILRWYKSGESIVLDRDQFEYVIDEVLEFITAVQNNSEQFIYHA